MSRKNERTGKSPDWRKRRTSLAAAVVASMLLTACGGGDTGGTGGSSGGKDPVLVGSLHPLSGGLQFEGTEAHQGVLVAEEEINKAGGIKALGGAPLKVLSEDNGGDVNRGSSQATRMIQEGSVAILGTMSSGVAAAVSPIAERAKVPLVITAAADPSLTERNFKYTLREHAHVGQSVAGAIDALQGISKESGMPVRRVAHLRLDIAAYESVNKLLATNLPQRDMELVKTVTVPLAETDFSTAVSQIRDARPDVLIISALLAQGSEIVRTMDAQKFRPPFTVGIAAGFANPAFAKDLPKLGEGIADVSYWYNPKSPTWTRFAAAYQTRFGRQPTTHAAQGYQATKLLADALERAGKKDGEALRDALSKTSLAEHLLPQQGPLTFAGNGQNDKVQSPMTQLIDGRPQVVWPAELAETKPVAPDPLATY